MLIGCSKGPSKDAALSIIKESVHADGTCTLSVDVMSKMSKQHTTKAICLPREASPQVEGCMNALVTGGLAAPMPASYLHDFTDESALAPSPYDRHVRDVTLKSCFTMNEDLRAGRFACADMTVDKISKITTTSETTADVRYLRTIKLRDSLVPIEKACGTTIHPAEDDTVAFAKNTASGKWELAPPPSQ